MSPGKREVPRISTDPRSSWEKRALERLPKSEICKLQKCMTTTLGFSWHEVSTTHLLLLAGWLARWAMSACPRHPGGLDYPPLSVC